jgi:hypothetical protein
MRFIIKRGQKYKAHIWLGHDTKCHMWSAGNMKKAEYFVCDDVADKDICSNCRSKWEGWSFPSQYLSDYLAGERP